MDSRLPERLSLHQHTLMGRVRLATPIRGLLTGSSHNSNRKVRQHRLQQRHLALHTMVTHSNSRMVNQVTEHRLAGLHLSLRTVAPRLQPTAQQHLHKDRLLRVAASGAKGLQRQILQLPEELT